MLRRLLTAPIILPLVLIVALAAVGLNGRSAGVPVSARHAYVYDRAPKNTLARLWTSTPVAGGRSSERPRSTPRTGETLFLAASVVGAESEPAAGDLAGAVCGGESFTPTTQVELADGTTIPIGQVKVGDEVLATDPQTGKTQAEPVTALWVNHDTDLLDLTVDTAQGEATIDTTQHHLFYDLTTHNWVEAQSLHPGDRLYTADGQLAAVVGSAVVPGAADMWDLTVNGDHDFYIDTLATAVLVHNCPAASAGRGLWHLTRQGASATARGGPFKSTFYQLPTPGGPGFRGCQPSEVDKSAVSKPAGKVTRRRCSARRGGVGEDRW